MIKLALSIGLVLAAAQNCATTAPAPAPAPAPPKDDRPDTCGRAQVAPFIGKSKDLLPAPPPGARWRVTCTSCQMTMDYSEQRLTILFDQATGIVKEARCG